MAMFRTIGRKAMRLRRTKSVVIILIILVAILCIMVLLSTQPFKPCHNQVVLTYNITKQQTTAEQNASLSSPVAKPNIHQEDLVHPPACYEGKKSHMPMYNPSKVFKGSTNFPIIEPNIKPTITDKSLYVVVVVNSGSHNGIHRLLRQAIRHTWGSDQEKNCTIKWRLFFTTKITVKRRYYIMIF